MSGSLNWPWSTKIIGQFVTRMCKFIGKSDAKYIMTLPLKRITLVLKALTDIFGLTEILVIISVSTFQTAVILYTTEILVIISVSTFQTAVILYTSAILYINSRCSNTNCLNLHHQYDRIQRKRDSVYCSLPSPENIMYHNKYLWKVVKPTPTHQAICL